MIILIPILLYIVITILLIWAVNFSLKKKNEVVRKKVKTWFIITAVVLLFPLGFFYFSYLFGLSLDSHYDVKKGTFLWYATMDNKTITDFPIIEPVGKVRFNSIGGDSPNIRTGWGLEYESKTDIEPLVKQIVQYLEKDGYEIKAVNRTQFYWIEKNKKNQMSRLYSGSNKKGESLDLIIEKQSNKINKIKCTIVF